MKVGPTGFSVLVLGQKLQLVHLTGNGGWAETLVGFAYFVPAGRRSTGRFGRYCFGDETVVGEAKAERGFRKL